MDEIKTNYPTNIQVFENGLKLGKLCITQMNCILNISDKRIELDVKYHYEKITTIIPIVEMIFIS